MTYTPEPLARLDLLLSAARLAHEVIFDLQNELTARGAAGEATSALLRESAAIALEELPAVLAEARRLAARWQEQSVLDPDEAGRTVNALQAELDRAEPRLQALRGRQRRIARDLQSRLDRERDR